MKTTFIVLILLSLTIIVAYYILIGNIDKSEPKIISLYEAIQIIGLEINTNDKDIYKDVGKVANDFNDIVKENPIPDKKIPWERLCVSTDYNKEKGSFKYIIGDVVTKTDYIPNGLQVYEIPAVTFAVFRIQPKSRIAWGITMGRMKRFIYTEWLPESDYNPSDIFGDFELHDDRSLGKNPEINLYVAIKEKDNI